MLQSIDRLKQKHEANPRISSDFLYHIKELEYHALYNRKPLKQFRDIHPKYYSTDSGAEVPTASNYRCSPMCTRREWLCRRAIPFTRDSPPTCSIPIIMSSNLFITDFYFVLLAQGLLLLSQFVYFVIHAPFTSLIAVEVHWVSLLPLYLV